MPVDPQLEGLLTLVAAGTPMHESTPQQARAGFRTLTVDMRPAEAVVPVGSVEDTTVAGAAGQLDARIYRPSAPGPAPTVMLFHGGGFVIGDLDTHDNMARLLCRGTGAVVVSVDYRLAPEHPFPAAALDAIAATRDVHRRLASFGGTEVLAVAGDSAGGNLSAVAAQQVPEVRAQFLIYPATDMSAEWPSRQENAAGYFLDLPTMLWFGGQYVPDGANLEDPLLSPIKGRLDGVAPAVVVTAELDPLRDEGNAYADRLAAAGVRVEQRTYPGMIHGFFDMGPWSTGAQAAIDDAVALFAGLLRSLPPS
ncbi:MAG: alpha/beta hydrolase [Marmoricola sp.]